MTEPRPQGVIAIMTRPDGYVAATAADFDRQAFGGFALHDSQRIRASDAVKREAIRRYVGTVVTDHLSSYVMEQIATELMTRGKWQITYVAIGYPESVTQEVARR